MRNYRTILRSLLIAAWTPLAILASAQGLEGRIFDAATGEPLIGAAVIETTTHQGTVTDTDGRFRLALKPGEHLLSIRYIGYTTKEERIRMPHPELWEVGLEAETQEVASVTVTARKNLESQRVLQQERINSKVAIENIGAREMSRSGLGDVEAGVKRLSGISIASAGQLVVRGLGDRYSITTLNGQPIASPNPDNKLIPLDIFPTSTISNITVSKVYEVTAPADYSGAHINIDTKEQGTENFFKVGLHIGGGFHTLGQAFYRMDHQSLFSQPEVDPAAVSMPLSEFRSYVKENNIFQTNFNVKKKNALPDVGGTLAFGHNFEVGNQRLSLLLSGGMGTESQRMTNAESRILEATGNTTDQYTYDRYTSELKIAALASVSMTLRENDRIGYTLFYARNAEDSYMRREGFDQEEHQLVGSHDVLHIYKLMTHQLSGRHEFGEKWSLRWDGSFSSTSSDEPDRRQAMFLKREDGSLGFFKLNQQETMRYFGALNEEEWNAQLNLDFRFGGRAQHTLSLGGSWRDKGRSYAGTRFYYDLSAVQAAIDPIEELEEWLGFGSIADGSIAVNRFKQPKDSYRAGTTTSSGFVAVDLMPVEKLLINAGVRYEHTNQWVEYFNDQSMAQKRTLEGDDLFPALNIRYTLGQGSLRLSASRTVTRPSFVEMAPFLYQESYGSAQLRGNEALQNGYNYNLDLRYEQTNDRGDLFSLTGYYKYLDQPIERVQMLAGGAAVHTFRNATHGQAAGVELEFRKSILKELSLNVNGTYMWTDVVLPDGGAYTNKERSLQGASPYLANVDLCYTHSWSQGNNLNLTLLYNLQGPRIHAVGISGLGDIEQQTVHTLNFAAGWQINRHFSLKLLVEDLLNRSIRFLQEVPLTGQEVEVERYRPGTGFQIGVEMKF